MTHLVKRIQEQSTTAKDLVTLFLGEKIGSGLSREVYQHALDRSLVIKVEDSGDRFQNILEYEIWNTVKDTKFAKWFAPCVAISANGHFLIQKKVEMIPKDQYPKRVPRFFGDLKYQNFGKIKGQFVALDYGTAHITAFNALLTVKTKKAEWWED